MKIVTWNMQGATSGDSASEKILYIKQLFSSNQADVICLQECGDLNGEIQQHPTNNGGGSNQNFIQKCFKTNLGTTSRPLQVCVNWLNSNTSSDGRCSTAIIARESVVANVGNNWNYAYQNAILRGAVGINVQGVWVWSIHASASGGGDVNNLLNIIHKHSNGECFVAGDFNRDPSTININGVDVFSSGIATHQNGGELDYAVSNARIPSPTIKVLPTQSDHHPVEFAIPNNGQNSLDAE